MSTTWLKARRLAPFLRLIVEFIRQIEEVVVPMNPDYSLRKRTKIRDPRPCALVAWLSENRVPKYGSLGWTRSDSPNLGQPKFVGGLRTDAGITLHKLFFWVLGRGRCDFAKPFGAG